MDSLKFVKEFHEAFGVEIKQSPDICDEDLNTLRLNLLYEELGELQAALEYGPEEEVLDALTDLQYVLDGTYLSLGFHRFKEVALLEVHRSNMSKLGEDGKPIHREDGKVLKGPNFSEPNLRRILDES